MHPNSPRSANKGWLLRVKLGPAWEECLFESRSDALEVAKALCDDYNAQVRGVKLVKVDGTDQQSTRKP